MNALGTTQREVRIRALGRPADTDALGAYFEANYDTLRRFAYWLTGNWSSAEDLVQEAFVRAAKAGARADRDGMLTYCRKTISSLHTSLARRAIVERRILARPQRHPMQEATDVSDRDEIWTQLMTLSPQQRACLVLRYYEDMTEAEIAASLGVSEGTVRKQIARGSEHLRGRLGRDA